MGRGRFLGRFGYFICAVGFSISAGIAPLQLFAQEPYVVKGSLGFGVRAASNPSVIKYWFSCGDWRNRTGIDDPKNEVFSAVVNRAAKTLSFSGDLYDCQVRDNATFAPLGNLRAVFDYSMTGITYDFDPIHNLPVFAIGHTPAAGSGSVEFTSPDGSVEFSTGKSLAFSFTEKYMMHAATATSPYYGTFATLADFTAYIGPRATPGNVLFSGTEGRGLGAWLMSSQQLQITIGGQTEDIIISGGDFHGDLVPNAAPECNASGNTITAKYSASCAAKVARVSLDSSASSDPDSFPAPLSYSWSSDCPEAVFDDPNSPAPSLIFRSFDAHGTPTSCSVSLVVSDGAKGTSCQSTVAVEECIKDCAGVVNGEAVVDRCGVCAGDGQLCLGCEGVTVTNSLLVIDSTSKALAALARKTARKISAIRGSSTIEEQKLVQQALKTHEQIWVDINSVPAAYQSCENQNLCVSTSYVEILNKVASDSNRLLSIAAALAKNLRKVLIRNGSTPKKADARERKILKRARLLDAEIQRELGTIPSFSSSCT